AAFLHSCRTGSVPASRIGPRPASRASPRSVGNGNPPADRLAAFQHVGDRDREVRDADPALACRVRQQVIAADPERAGPLPRFDHCRRADEGPVQILDVAVDIQRGGVGERDRLPPGREIARIDQPEAGRHLQAAGPADHHEPAHAALAQPGDQAAGGADQAVLLVLGPAVRADGGHYRVPAASLATETGSAASPVATWTTSPSIGVPLRVTAVTMYPRASSSAVIALPIGPPAPNTATFMPQPHHAAGGSGAAAQRTPSVRRSR